MLAHLLFCRGPGAKPIAPNFQTHRTFFSCSRRIEKDVDGDTTTYVYDGGNVIAEYDDTGSLAKKYIHGARVDELVCMIDVAGGSAVYYYHYDGLGSVVALSNSSGNSCQSYVYSAYGRVWAEYPDFKANPYMFTGRRFDYETGLYYYRARYYNPYIGRFLQTDPIGYGDGINWYVYCGNNPLCRTDTSGLAWVGDPNDPIWIQEYASSCGPATVMNALAELVIQYNNEAYIRGLFEDLIGLIRPRGVSRGYDERIWGQRLTGNGVTGTETGRRGVTMEEVQTVLNNLLQANNSSQRYGIEQGGSWDLDDMKAGARNGPVIYSASFRGFAHCEMITTVEENTTKTINGKEKKSDFYWIVNPLHNYAQMAWTSAMKHHLSHSFSYQNSRTNAWQLPILVLN